MLVVSNWIYMGDVPIGVLVEDLVSTYMVRHISVSIQMNERSLRLRIMKLLYLRTLISPISMRVLQIDA